MYIFSEIEVKEERGAKEENSGLRTCHDDDIMRAGVMKIEIRLNQDQSVLCKTFFKLYSSM